MADKKIHELDDLLSITDETLMYAVKDGADFKTTPKFLGRNLPDAGIKGYLDVSFSLPLIQAGQIEIDKVVSELFDPNDTYTLPSAPKGRVKILINKSDSNISVNTNGLGFSNISLTEYGSITLLSDGVRWIATSLRRVTLS